MDIQNIKKVLTENPTREFLIEAISSASFISTLYKPAIYMAVQSMSEEDVKGYVSLLLNILGFIERNDREGLSKFINKAIPDPNINKLVMGYADRFYPVQ